MRRHWCSNLTRDMYEETVQLARGQKSAFFAHLQNATAPYQLTGPKSLARCRKYHIPANESRPRVMFIGDSILEEIRLVYASLVPRADTFFATISSLGHYDGQIKRNATLVRPWRGR